MTDTSPVIITYDNVAVFDNLAGTQPIPFVSKSQQPIRYGAHWGQQSVFSIDGQITGSGPELWQAKDNIINGFKKDFRAFKINEGGDNYVDVTGVIRSITFGEGKYHGIIDYSISIEAYEESLFSGTYGVLNPVDQISYSQTEDEKIQITHELSAKGFQTGTQANGSSALGNAKDFVFSRRDSWKAKAKPFFASGEADFSSVEPILVSTDETIDRFEGVYGLVDTFVFSRTGLDRVIESRTVSVESGITNEVITATIDGEIYAGKKGSLTTARDHLKNLEHYDIANSQCPDGVDLYHVPINFNVSEDPKTNTISYSVSYDNLNIFELTSLSGTAAGAKGAYFDYGVTVNRDTLTDIVTASIEGTVRGRGNAIHRRKNIQDYYLNDMVNSPDNGISGYLYTCMKADYDSVMGSDKRIPNPYPTSISISSGNANGEIQISAEFSDEDFVDGFLSADYSINVNTAMPIKTVNASARFDENGFYHIGDIDVGSRETVDIAINMTYDREYYATNVVAESESDSLYTNNETMQSMIGNLASTYTPLTYNNNNLQDANDANKVRLENESYEENRDSRSLSANYSYSFNGSKFPDSAGGYGKTFMRDKYSRNYISNKYFNTRGGNLRITDNG